MGYMHLTGQGAEVDHRQAFSYFRQAVEGGKDWPGLADGLFYLGEWGSRGVEKVALPRQGEFWRAAAEIGGPEIEELRFLPLCPSG